MKTQMASVFYLMVAGMCACSYIDGQHGAAQQSQASRYAAHAMAHRSA